MYNWHGNLHPPPPPHTQLAAPSSTAYQVSSLRWLPTIRQQQGHGTGHGTGTGTGGTESTGATGATGTDTISNLRMAQNSNHQPVSVVETPRGHRSRATATAAAAAAVPGGDEMDEGSESDSREMVLDERHEDSHTFGSGEATEEPTGGTGTGTGTEPGTGTGNGTGNGGDRKHGKRLTTKEEVSLFDICNRHAHEFGQRSNLCKWWVTVTTEFTHDQGHPYSWHSVRRKVEMVTKQRMKFLEELREKNTAVDGSRSEDLSNPRWRAAVDAWIPTWQRWEDAEAKRIEKRDSRKTRKRKRPWEFSTWEEVASGGSSPVDSQGRSQGHGHSQSRSHSHSHSHSQSQSQGQNTDTPKHPRLPPGFDSMFSPPNPSHTPITSPAQPAQPSPGPSPAQPSPSPGTGHPSPAQPSAGQPSAGPGPENMMSALLETLGKLNKHLEAEPAAPVPAPSHTTPAAAHTTATAPVPTAPTAAASLQTLKEELRRELRAEIRREIELDRASLEEKLDSVQRTQEMILEMLRQEP